MFFMFVFDRRSGSKMEALLNSLQTIFICFLLGFGAMTFSSDANRFVLSPIERMIAKIDKIRNNPLAALTIGDEEQHKEQAKQLFEKVEPDVPIRRAMSSISEASISSSLRNRKGRCPCLHRCWNKLRACYARSTESPEPMETVVLEKTIIKIGSLLALGFGEAGAEIIGQNMKGESSSTLNAMVPGRRVDAIFGFCDIRSFMSTTEVLQDQIMVFVNQIAGVVHSCANEFYGSPNKIVGNAFLLAWRLSGHPEIKQQKLADMALVAIVKIIAQVNKSPLLAEYRHHPKLLKRMPNYHVKMGFGLHSGWAIEGAIGSEFKIDASYLSPNVNMAARLESVTRVYGCMIIASDAVIRLLSDGMREECRHIDAVLMEGTKTPINLYALDLDDTALDIMIPHRIKELSRNAKFRQRLEVERRKAERWSDDYHIHDFFERETDITRMRDKFTMEFFSHFKMAFLNYEAGEWAVAKKMLEVTRHALENCEDGPSAALLKFMQQYGYAKPEDWKGYRMLTARSTL